jgi:hemerythrin
MEWSEAYSTGVPELDVQHEQLFAMVKVLEDALEAGDGSRAYGEFLRLLTRHVESHFGAEEACMRRHQCPVWQLNQSAHAMFTANLRRMEERHAAEGYSEEAARGTVALMHRWLQEHIARIDVQLKAAAAGG